MIPLDDTVRVVLLVGLAAAAAAFALSGAVLATRGDRRRPQHTAARAGSAHDRGPQLPVGAPIGPPRHLRPPQQPPLATCPTQPLPSAPSHPTRTREAR
ncbi:hypothetical protein ACFQE5_04740 [Pseudonocardia hispaniensis]|uniref:Uncharacterized protein n=1 Tax=Pseudonocardia hispaniensis TaxID=904933 RepID=A0ABW1IYW4_9PSEU